MPDIWVEMTFRSYITEIECIGEIDKKYLLPLVRSPFLDISRNRCCGGGCIICIPTVTVWEVSHFAKIKKTESLKSYNQDIIDLFMPLVEEKLKNLGEMDDESSEIGEMDGDASDNDAADGYSSESREIGGYSSESNDESTDREDESDDSQEDDIDNYQSNSDEDVNIDQDAESYSETTEEYSDNLPNEYTYYRASNMSYANTGNTDAENAECCEPCDNNLKRKNNDSNNTGLNKKTKLD